MSIRRNTFTSRRLSAWIGTQVHTCDACKVEFRSPHAAAHHTCEGVVTVKTQGRDMREYHELQARMRATPFPRAEVFYEGTVTGRLYSRAHYVKPLTVADLTAEYVKELQEQDPEKRRQWLTGDWDIDYSKLEERVLAHGRYDMVWFDEVATIPLTAWDNWKPGRDV